MPRRHTAILDNDDTKDFTSEMADLSMADPSDEESKSDESGSESSTDMECTPMILNRPGPLATGGDLQKVSRSLACTSSRPFAS